MKAIFVCNYGGHLAELFELAPRLPFSPNETIWVTSKSPQSESLLAGLNTHFVPDIPSRDMRGVIRSLRDAWKLLRRHKPEALVTTGAALALGYTLVARIRGVRVHYIESAARLNGPSLTGRILSKLPGVRFYTQHAQWADAKWKYCGSVFDNFEVSVTELEPAKKMRVLVTVGTTDFPFDRLLERVDKIVPDGWKLTWQIGASNYAPTRGKVCKSMSATELRAAHEATDIVIAHAGVGSSLLALDTGHVPILVPREAHYGEHVDDHQSEIASYLAALEVAQTSAVEELTLSDLHAAAKIRVARRSKPQPFELT